MAFISEDSAVFHFNFKDGIISTTDFAINYHYGDELIDSSLISPAISYDDGSSWTDIEDHTFTVPEGTMHFDIRLRVNNDPNIDVDYKVYMSIVPLEHLDEFETPDGTYTAVEFINATAVSSVKVADDIVTDVGEGLDGVAHYLFTPNTGRNGILRISTMPVDAPTTLVQNFKFSIDGINWTNVDPSLLINIPIATKELYIKFTARTNSVMLDDTSFTLIIEEESDPKSFYGDPLEIDYNIVDTTILPLGTFIGSYCIGTTKFGRYSDGVGGYTTVLLQEKSVDCGFTHDVAGTVLTTYCANYNRYKKVADGIGGYYIAVEQENVPGLITGCGYEPPIEGDYEDLASHTTLTAFNGSVVSNAGLGFGSTKRDGAKTVFGAMYGKWYMEGLVSIPTGPNYKPIAIGVVTSAHPMGSWLGSTNSSWGWWPFEGTKYHNDTQGFFSGTVGDKAVISLLLDIPNHKLDIWINGIPRGTMYSNLPSLTKLYVAVNATDDSYILMNFGQNEFVYEPPAGYYHGYGPALDAPPEAGTILREYCDFDTHEMKRDTANGNYGFTTTVIATNVVDCGYDPTPPLGTILSYFCQGTDRWKRVADGIGGYTEVLHEINSKTCGYTPPPVPALIPTTLNPAWYNGNTVFSNDNKTAVIDGSVRSIKDVYSGRWYWEVVADTTNIIVGIGSTDVTILPSMKIGEHDNTWGYNLTTNKLLIGQTVVSVPTTYTFNPGDIIGISLDFVNQKMSFSINGSWKEDLVIEDLPIVNFHAMISGTYVDATSPKATVHFGDDLIYDEPVGYVPGLGNTTTTYTRKNTHHSYSCQGLNRYQTLHDGGGGTYSVLYEVNSPSCGWKPPNPYGMLEGIYCTGPSNLDKWGKFANGNYGQYNELIESPSTDCGYLPEGYLISTYCDESDNRIGIYSNGLVPQGSYEALITFDSADCKGGGGSGSTGSEELDPLLPHTQEGIIISVTPIPAMGEGIIIDTELEEYVPPGP